MAFALGGHVVRMREFKYGLVIPGVAIAVTLGLIFVGRTLAQPCYWRRCVASFCLWRSELEYIVPPMLAGAAAIAVAI